MYCNLKFLSPFEIGLPSDHPYPLVIHIICDIIFGVIKLMYNVIQTTDIAEESSN